MKQLGIRLFIVVNVLLALALAWLWIGPDGQPRNLAWEPPQPLPPELGGEAAVLPQALPMDTNLFVATLDRPLFSPSRRPAPPPAPPVEAKQPEPDPLANIHLFGIYSTEDGLGGMLARVDGKVRRVALNENLGGGWTLKSVQERQATFSRNGEERTIPLVITRPAVAPKVAAPSTQQPAGAPSPTPAAAAVPPVESAAGSAEVQRQQMEEARLELQRRRNELRAKAGAPPLP